MPVQWRKVGNQLVVTTSTEKEPKKRKAASKQPLSFGEALVLSQDGVVAIGNQQDGGKTLKATVVKREPKEAPKRAVVKRELKEAPKRAVVKHELKEASRRTVVKRELKEDLPVPKGRPVKLEPGIQCKPAEVAARPHRPVKREPGVQESSTPKPVIKREPGTGIHQRQEPLIVDLVDLTELADNLAEAIVPMADQSRHRGNRKLATSANGPSNDMLTTAPSGSLPDSCDVAGLFPPGLLQQLLHTMTSRRRTRRTETRPNGSCTQMWMEELRKLLVRANASGGTSRRSVLGSGLVRRQVRRESKPDGSCLMRETLTLQRTRRISEAATPLNAGRDRGTAPANGSSDPAVPRPPARKRLRLI